MNWSDRFIRLFRSVFPAPFTIAVLLTAFTFVLAIAVSRPDDASVAGYSLTMLDYWQKGLWDSSLLVFAIQMMLMLVLGHVLALSSPVNRLILNMVKYCRDTASAAAIVALLTMLVSLFNWGLGLIFGAIFARKAGEYAAQNNIPINYPLIGAAGYSGLMIWHGGLSGSSLIKIAEYDHLRNMMTGIIPADQIALLPHAISFSETVFSPMNITLSMALLIVIPSFLYFWGKSGSKKMLAIENTILTVQEVDKKQLKGAERLDHSTWPALFFALVILAYAGYIAILREEGFSLSFITPDYINFLLFGLGILFHGSFSRFVHAVEKAITGASGILIQFPLYFGIMGLMKSSGLINEFSAFFVKISSDTTYPILTFFSGGLVNVFVPSGGGQWAVQGPIIIKAATELHLPLAKNVLAFAYGDQITNMLQPFWALPLLGITGLKAKELLPYTIVLMLIGAVIFIGGLLIF